MAAQNNQSDDEILRRYGYEPDEISEMTSKVKEAALRMAGAKISADEDDLAAILAKGDFETDNDVPGASISTVRVMCPSRHGCGPRYC
jgi:hypothetical protein